MGRFARKMRKQLSHLGCEIIKDSKGNNVVVKQAGESQAEKGQQFLDAEKRPILSVHVNPKSYAKYLNLGGGRGLIRHPKG